MVGGVACQLDDVRRKYLWACGDQNAGVQYHEGRGNDRHVGIQCREDRGN